MNKYIIASLALLCNIFLANAQDDMEKLANDALSENTQYALGTFFSTRIVTGHSVFMMPEKGLDFRIHHRFGQFNSGFNNFYGMDESSSYLSLEYGVKDWLNVGLGRATYKDIFNGYCKFWLLRQCSGDKDVPVSIVYVVSSALQSTIYNNDTKRNEDFAARLNYTHQLLIASMITPAFSAQITPTLVHRNMVPVGDYNNNTYAVGIGGRYKITNTFSLNCEWYHILNPDKPVSGKVYDPFSVGVDIQVASHVFQIHVTNSQLMTENAFITETNGNFFKGDIRPGFNISQVFTFK
jgi:hypothetical protein